MKKILLIDDDLDNRELFTVVLNLKNFKVIAIDHCIPVEEIIKLNPNLVILDHHLGAQKGGEFCLELKKNKLSKHIPIILISAVNHLKEISKAALADGFLEKPFDITELENIAERFAL